MSNKLLADVLKRAKTWPIEDQKKLAQFADEIEADRLGPYEMTPEEEAAVNEGIAQADRGEFASEEEVAAIFRRFRAQ
jgi:predicted transcriptional regulator